MRVHFDEKYPVKELKMLVCAVNGKRQSIIQFKSVQFWMTWAILAHCFVPKSNREVLVIRTSSP